MCLNINKQAILRNENIVPLVSFVFIKTIIFVSWYKQALQTCNKNPINVTSLSRHEVLRC